MKHFVDNITGVVVFIPENKQDRKALFHLMDCSDLTKFTEYISTTGEQDNITQDLGVTAREAYGYLEAEEYETQVTEEYETQVTEEYETQVTEQHVNEITETALIGFNR